MAEAFLKWYGGWGHNFHIFSAHFFRQNKFEADQETRNVLGGSGDMLPRKIFGNLHAVIAILVFFE